jgi:hypothetical protein
MPACCLHKQAIIDEVIATRHIFVCFWEAAAAGEQVPTTDLSSAVLALAYPKNGVARQSSDEGPPPPNQLV